jgi:prepilin-type N-terminal cleavage/methylation domain-containing protein
MSRLRAARHEGFTLIELLIVMSIFIVILGATLDAMARFTRNNRVAEVRSDQAEEARTALDRQARQLRNLAKRVADPTINKATGYDFVFQTADPSRTWVRYCLDTQAPATPARGRLWEMVSDSLAAPSTSACPGTGWTQSVVVADHVVNRNGGADNTVFSYSCLNGATPCPPADSSSVTGVGATLYVDDDVAREPTALRVSTAVFLRNQNEPPTAVMSPPQSAGTRKIFLNGSGSSDPEGRTLRYYWYIGVTAPTFNCADGPPPTPPRFQGVALTYTFPTSTALGSNQSVTLVVCDAGDLQARTSPTIVKVPST